MNSPIRFCLVLMAAASLLVSCSEKIEPQPTTYSQLLTGTTSKAWRLVSFQVIDEGQASGVIPIAGQLDPCEADDQYVFYADAEKKFEYTDGPGKCSPQDPNILLTDTWTLINGSATLEMPLPQFFGGSKLPFTIKNLTPTVLTVELYLEKVTTTQLNASYRFTFNSTTGK